MWSRLSGGTSSESPPESRRHVWLAGGEPTLRPDLPELLASLPGAGLVTDGVLLQSREGCRELELLGATRIRIVLYSARAAAHDWIAGVPGRWKETMRAIRTALDSPLEVSVEIVLTRPTQPHLEETLELCARLGVQATVRTPAANEIRPQDLIMLAPVDYWPREAPGTPRPDSVTVRFDLETPSRAIRQELVRAAQQGAPLLRIASPHTFSRPDSPDLLRDAGMLSFQRVEAAGDAAGLRGFSDGQLARLRFLSRIEVPAYDPVIERLKGIAPVHVCEDEP